MRLNFLQITRRNNERLASLQHVITYLPNSRPRMCLENKIISLSPMEQKRLKKYSRDSETLAVVASRQITNASLQILATIHDYRIIPTSLIVRLVPGHEKSTYRHLQQLYHKALINRFAFMRGKNPSEFYYYLDNTEALELLAL